MSQSSPNAQVLQGGFAAPPQESAVAFRAIMSAMARPGQIEQITGTQPPAPLSVAMGTALVTLCDPETPLYLGASVDCPAVRDWITFHVGAPLVAPQQAMFAVGTWADMPLSDFPMGTPEYPDRSTTVIADLPELANCGATLRGPGIRDAARLTLPDAASLQRNAAQFPLGLDFLFTCGDRIAALPRTTRVS